MAKENNVLTLQQNLQILMMELSVYQNKTTSIHPHAQSSDMRRSLLAGIDIPYIHSCELQAASVGYQRLSPAEGSPPQVTG